MSCRLVEGLQIAKRHGDGYPRAHPPKNQQPLIQAYLGLLYQPRHRRVGRPSYTLPASQRQLPAGHLDHATLAADRLARYRLLRRFNVLFYHGHQLRRERLRVGFR